MTVVEKGPGVWDMEIVWLDVDDLVPNAENPNQQDDRTFNALVRSIQQEGWTQPVQAVFDSARGKHEIVAGEHRWRAARILQSKVPVLVLPADEFDRDRRDWNVVKDNMLRGSLNPVKFTRLYERMAGKYDAEVLQALMGFTSEEAFRRVYKEVVDALPPGIAEALKASQAEIRSIDDLSSVLNRIFRDHGETLDSNLMTFSFGGREVLWIRADKVLWTEVSAIAKVVSENHLDMTVVMTEALRGVADRARAGLPGVGAVESAEPAPVEAD